MLSIFYHYKSRHVYCFLSELLPKHNVLTLDKLCYIDGILLNQSIKVIKATTKRNYDNQQVLNIHLFCWIFTEDASLEINTLSAKYFGLSAQRYH